MKYNENKDKLTISGITNFNIEQILECGQCFRFNKIEAMHYEIIALGKVLNIKQVNDEVTFYPCNKADFIKTWSNYFDMDTDYNLIIQTIAKNDEILKKATDYGKGIRILNQDPYETIISFIISQNNNIARIKGIISNMAEKYGKELKNGYAFPLVEELNVAKEEDLFNLKTGFRAKYIRDCLDKLTSGEVNLDIIDSLSTDELLSYLTKIKGVGQKVGDCVMLFSMGRREVFPTDVWVKRVMETLYFNSVDTNIKDIHNFAKEKWGHLAGYAQQYLFYYARSLKIGTDKEKN